MMLHRANGIPEASARYGLEAGVVYTPVDGNQHGLLMGLIAWARSLTLKEQPL